MTDVFLKATQAPPGAVVSLRAEGSHTLLAQLDETGIYFYDRRGGGRHCLLTREQLLALYSAEDLALIQAAKASKGRA